MRAHRAPEPRARRPARRSAPLLVDPLGADGVVGTGDDDLHLRRVSPCINAGDDSAVPIFAALEIDDEARIQRPWPFAAAVVDIGADEVGRLTILFLGTAAGLDMEVEVDGSAAGIGGTDAMQVPGGSRLDALLRSTDQSQVGLPCAITLDLFVAGAAPSFPGLPGAHFGPAAMILLFPALPPQGLPLVIDPIPQGLAGSMMLQGQVLTPLAANGWFDSTRGRELRF